MEQHIKNVYKYHIEPFIGSYKLYYAGSPIKLDEGLYLIGYLFYDKAASKTVTLEYRISLGLYRKLEYTDCIMPDYVDCLLVEENYEGFICDDVIFEYDNPGTFGIAKYFK